MILQYFLKSGLRAKWAQGPAPGPWAWDPLARAHLARPLRARGPLARPPGPGPGPLARAQGPAPLAQAPGPAPLARGP